jgi:hypothetical protein
MEGQCGGERHQLDRINGAKPPVAEGQGLGAKVLRPAGGYRKHHWNTKVVLVSAEICAKARQGAQIPDSHEVLSALGLSWVFGGKWLAAHGLW